MERKEGYYFVRYTDWLGEPVHHWYLAYWNSHTWSCAQFPKQNKVSDEWDEIDERPIIRHTDLPASFNVKKGMTFERHLLENYYVALEPLPIPDGDRTTWVTVEKGCSHGKTGTIIDPEKMAELYVNMKPEDLITDNNGHTHQVKDYVTTYTPSEGSPPVNYGGVTGPELSLEIKRSFERGLSTDELVDRILDERDAAQPST